MKPTVRLLVSLLVSAFAFSVPTYAQALDKLSIVVFGAPSLGAFMPPVIKAKKFDAANRLDIDFAERTPDAYTAQFNSGEFKLGGSAALLTVGLADIRGVKVKYLFNLFDLWGAVVTSRPEIKSLKDLEGRQLAAARATTNFVMFQFFARQAGVDVSKIEVVNTATPGLVGYALADRADAVQIWEPAYTLLKAKKPTIHELDQRAAASWSSSWIVAQGEEAHDPRARPARRGELVGVRRRRFHPLSRRRGAHRLDRAEPGAGRAALRHLQAGGRLDPAESGRGGAADRAEVERRGPEGRRRSDPRQRAPRHARRAGGRHAQGDRGGLPCRAGGWIFPEGTVGGLDLHEGDSVRTHFTLP
jgi:hypothetical protein